MGPFIVLDIETTGRDPGRDHIIEVAAIKWEDFKIVGRFERLVNPRMVIPYEITMLTGITNEMVSAAEVFSEMQKELFEFAGDLPIVGHNISFDMSFLRIHKNDMKNAEIDTLALAKILLRKESSYALEVLMRTHNLQIRTSHRAMTDTETTVDFLEFLLGKISEIDESLWPQLEGILGKSDWPGKDVFEKPKKKAAAEKASGKEKTSEKKSNKVLNNLRTAPLPPSCLWQKSSIDAFSNEGKILLESPGEIPFKDLKGTPLVIAYESHRKREDLILAAKENGITINSLKEPSGYLSPKKLSEKLSQEKFANDEAIFLLKIALWNNETLTGDREEISIEREEYGLFETLADTEAKDKFWLQSLKKALACDVILIHHHGLARGLATKICNTQSLEKVPETSGSDKKRTLIILETSKLEDSFTFAYWQKISEANLRPCFGDKATVAMGLIGIFYEHLAGEGRGGFSENVVLNDGFCNTNYWKQALFSFENLPENPQNAEKKQQILRALNQATNSVRWVASFAGEVAFYTAPKDLIDIFGRGTLGFEKILIHDPAINSDMTLKFMRDIFGLGSDWKEVKEKSQTPSFSNLKIEVNEDFPSPYDEGYFKECFNLFAKTMKEKKGKSLFLFSSKKAVEGMHSALLKPSQQMGVKLISVGPSGGVGKSLALFLNNPDTSVLLSTNQVLPYIQEIEDHIEVIVFQKIPFDPPGDSLLAARAEMFDDGFNQYNLPRAIMKFRAILGQLNQGRTKKACHLLDSRLLSRDYGKLFIF